jgi:methenyltetrahydromethanopterin cyclohydrolase
MSIDKTILYDTIHLSPKGKPTMETLLYHLLMNYAVTVYEIEKLPHENVAELKAKAKAIQSLTIDTAESIARAMQDIKTAGRTLAVTPSRN